MRCRRVICAACSTRMDGINYCHACLAALGQRKAKRVGGSRDDFDQKAVALNLAEIEIYHEQQNQKRSIYGLCVLRIDPKGKGSLAEADRLALHADVC